MKGDPEFVILKYPAWLDTQKFESRILGSVVKYPLQPTEAYFLEYPLQYYTDDFQEGSLSDFVFANTETRSSDVSTALDSIMGSAFKGNRDHGVNLAGKLLRFKRLQRLDNFWTQLKEDYSVRDNVPGWISRFNTWPPCLVVGIMIADDVELDFSGKGGLKAEAGASRNMATVFKAKTGRSYIFALELRIITTALLRRRELKLKEFGPKVSDGRLAGNNDSDENDDDNDGDDEPMMDDLILERFTDIEYDEMVG
ncbi:hypothetical protein H072_4298 [Dactylellina haptotyla CBS 200.50]|uniref:Uncharacterized protein n=1 Tax=Dactylellina haptotyla (strain CBS 200.50) TaxID=1284197 RepID=S8C2A9_DACHA|nr:hypothetical protein H072_4298 [Dactylellina haptotyla CBS 200.50]